jgi:uncharacterized protein YegJ (DUF2314 family)
MAGVLAGFDKRNRSDNFLVKSRFADGDSAEWMWLTVDKIKDDWIFGKLANDPGSVKSLRLKTR